MNEKKQSNWIWLPIVFVSVFLLIITVTKEKSIDSDTEYFPTPTGQNESSSQPDSQPSLVLVDAGSPLECSLLDEPIQIGEVAGLYTCQAPGAYLSSVDITSDPMTAMYFTTNTQGDTVTYGPESKEVLAVQ